MGCISDEVVQLIRTISNKKFEDLQLPRYSKLKPGAFMNINELLNLLAHSDSSTFKDVFGLFDAQVTEEAVCDGKTCSVPSTILPEPCYFSFSV